MITRFICPACQNNFLAKEIFGVEYHFCLACGSLIACYSSGDATLHREGYGAWMRVHQSGLLEWGRRLIQRRESDTTEIRAWLDDPIYRATCPCFISSKETLWWIKHYKAGSNPSIARPTDLYLLNPRSDLSGMLVPDQRHNYDMSQIDEQLAYWETRPMNEL